MKIGDIVQHYESKKYGTVHYSSFGLSIHSFDEYEGRQVLCKSLGDKPSEVAKHWEVVKLPEGYVVHEYGGLIKTFDSLSK